MAASLTALFGALLLIAGSLPAGAQAAPSETPVEIMDSDATTTETPPGGLVTRALFVSNRNSDEAAMSLSVVAPEGWSVIGGEQQLELALKSGDTVLASFRVPTAARAGSYRVAVTVRGSASRAVLASYEIPVSVAAVEALGVEYLDAPEYVLAGELYQARFRVTNRGNTPVEARIDVRSTPEFELTADVETAGLDPAASAVVTITVRTPADLGAPVRQYLHVAARTSEPARDGATASSSFGVDVLPRVTGTMQLYEVLPVTLTAVQALKHGGEDRFAFLGRIEAKGPLSASGNDQLSFLFSAPLDDTGTIFPQPPELRIAYDAPGISLFGGTKFFALSSLTERSLSGSGVEGSVQAGAFRVGAYHVLTNPNSDAAAQTAGFVSYTDTRGSSLRLNVLDNDTLPTRGGVVLLGAEGLWRHPSGATIEAEYASADLQGRGDALRLALAGTHTGVSYQLAFIRASSDYAGPVRDREECSASVSSSILSALRLSSSVKLQRTALDRDAPAFLESFTNGLSWSVDPASSLAIGWEHVQADDNLTDPSKTVEYDEDLGRLSFSRTVGSAKVGLSTELGARRGTPDWATAVSERYQASVSYAPDPAWSLAATVTLEATGMEIDAEATWRPTSRTQLHLAYVASEKHSSFYAGREGLRIDVSHRLRSGLALTARGDYSPDRSVLRPADFSVQAEVSLPLGLPLRKRAVGRVAGTVRDAADGVGVPDVILRIGQRVAVTDLRGTFLFPDLPPGTYYVTVDVARVRQDRLVAEELPLSVEVEPFRDSRIALSLVAPARLEGKVTQYRTADDGSIVLAGPLPDLMVELRRDGQTRKALTTRDGTFTFAGLPPGAWRLHYSTTEIPPYTAFAENDLDITLAPGNASTVEARLLPVRREMKIVDEGEILEEAAPADKGQ